MGAFCQSPSEVETPIHFFLVDFPAGVCQCRWLYASVALSCLRNGSCLAVHKLDAIRCAGCNVIHYCLGWRRGAKTRFFSSHDLAQRLAQPVRREWLRTHRTGFALSQRGLATWASNSYSAALSVVNEGLTGSGPIHASNTWSVSSFETLCSFAWGKAPAQPDPLSVEEQTLLSFLGMPGSPLRVCVCWSRRYLVKCTTTPFDSDGRPSSCICRAVAGLPATSKQIMHIVPGHIWLLISL